MKIPTLPLTVACGVFGFSVTQVFTWFLVASPPLWDIEGHGIIAIYALISIRVNWRRTYL